MQRIFPETGHIARDLQNALSIIDGQLRALRLCPKIISCVLKSSCSEGHVVYSRVAASNSDSVELDGDVTQIDVERELGGDDRTTAQHEAGFSDESVLTNRWEPSIDTVLSTT